jgi:hypothetical protein
MLGFDRAPIYVTRWRLEWVGLRDETQHQRIWSQPNLRRVSAAIEDISLSIQ